MQIPDVPELRELIERYANAKCGICGEPAEWFLRLRDVPGPGINEIHPRCREHATPECMHLDIEAMRRALDEGPRRN